MKNTLVIFDSYFGNTKKIAETISTELEAKLISVADFSANDLIGVNNVIIGSPIIAWRPSERMGSFLQNLPSNAFDGIKIATFDTRVKLFIHGDAMSKIAEILKSKGADTLIKSHPFYVKGKEGPLLDGEIEKATIWAKEIKSKI